MLESIADSVRNMFNSPSHIVARYGGEEFVVLLPEVSAQESLARAEKLRITIHVRTYSVN